jgi:hypothetical protein
VEHNERLVRIPLPVELINRVDRLVLSGAGGFETRTDFFREAAMTLLDEYAGAGGPAQRAFDALVVEETARPAADDTLQLEGTVLRPPVRSGVILADTVVPTRAQMLFGLHNRDYPSIWALRQVADIAGAAPRELEECLRLVTAEAWRFGTRLVALEEKVGQKLTALFPTNSAKRQSADDAFRNFALGGCARTGEGMVATGPLFEWKVCALSREQANGNVVIGLTEAGYDLLTCLDGISLRLPHSRDHAEAFLDHLRKYDPSDLRGFEFVTQVIGREVNREELVEAFAGELVQRQDQAATFAAGYVARAREWGLVEAKQRNGRYALTPFGEAIADVAAGVVR